MQPHLADSIGLHDRAILEVFYSTGMRRMGDPGTDGTFCDIYSDGAVVRGITIMSNCRQFCSWRCIQLQDIARDVTGCIEGTVFKGD